MRSYRTSGNKIKVQYIIKATFVKATVKSMTPSDVNPGNFTTFLATGGGDLDRGTAAALAWARANVLSFGFMF